MKKWNYNKQVLKIKHTLYDKLNKKTGSKELPPFKPLKPLKTIIQVMFHIIKDPIGGCRREEQLHASGP